MTLKEEILECLLGDEISTNEVLEIFEKRIDEIIAPLESKENVDVPTYVGNKMYAETLKRFKKEMLKS